MIHPQLQANDFNDDSLGRALDALYEKGVTEAFATVASKALATYGVEHRFVHLDSTTFSLHGAYEVDSDDENAIQVTHGYSRDYRPDLKQVVVQLLCSYRSQIPVWLEVLDGHQADKTSFPNTINSYLAQLQEGETPYFIADSALYTATNIRSLSNVRWICRVPETIKAVKELYQTLPIEVMQPATENGYRYLSIESSYGDVAQRWLIVYSQAAYQREVATLEKKITTERKAAEKSLQQLNHKEFDTQVAAREAVSTLSAGWRYHEPQIELIDIPHYPNPGRPTKEQSPTRIGFKSLVRLLNSHRQLNKPRTVKVSLSWRRMK